MENVQEDEAEGQVERVHENLAEELGFEAQPVQLLGETITPVSESGITSYLANLTIRPMT